MFYPPFISNKTESTLVLKKWVCLTGGEAFKRRLTHGVVLIIMA